MLHQNPVGDVRPQAHRAVGNVGLVSVQFAQPVSKFINMDVE